MKDIIESMELIDSTNQDTTKGAMVVANLMEGITRAQQESPVISFEKVKDGIATELKLTTGRNGQTLSAEKIEKISNLLTDLYQELS